MESFKEPYLLPESRHILPLKMVASYNWGFVIDLGKVDHFFIVQTLCEKYIRVESRNAVS